MLIKYRHLIFLPIFLGWLIMGIVGEPNNPEYQIQLDVQRAKGSMYTKSHWQQVMQTDIVELQSKGMFNVYSLEQKLKANSWIKTANVYKTNPNLWHIQISEKQPIAVMEYDHGHRLLNDIATEMHVTEKYLKTHKLPKVQVLSNQANLDSIAQIVNYLSQHKLLRKLYTLKVTNDGYGLHFYEHKQKKKAYLSNQKNLAIQLKKFKIFYRAVWSKQFEAYNYINLSVPSQVVAK